MSSNFDFLKQDYKEVYEAVVLAESPVFTASRTSAFYSRFAMERAVTWMFGHDSDLRLPYEQTLSALTHEPTFRNSLPPGMFERIFYIRKLGNLAVHTNSDIKDFEALTALKNLHTFLGWFYKTYTKNPQPIERFDEALLPRGESIDKTSSQLKELEEKLSAREEELLKQENLLKQTEEELSRLRTQIHENKTYNSKVIEPIDYSEAETRRLLIDLLLKEAGWDPQAKNVAEYEVHGMPNDPGVGYVDYVLWGDNGLPLGIVEAKKTQIDPKVGQRQAELYANCLEKEKGQRPIIFYTNGYKTWIWDDTFYSPREIQGFLNKDQLQRLINRRTDRKDLTKSEINKNIAGRYYQIQAIKNLAETYQAGARKALLVMATGTGKTRVAISAVELLMKNGWVKNVLFLADRTALVKQAKNSFKVNLPNVSVVDLTKDKESTGSRIAFSTYPTMLNFIDETALDGQKRFGPGHFDLIIIDEAHRSVYMKYGSIFDYFDSLLLGLTATPKDDVDKNTYELFNLEDNVPTYAYELEQAVQDGFLVPFKPKSVPLKFPQEGITYDELTEEEKAEYELTFRDEYTEEVPDNIRASAVNDWLFNKDTVDKVINHLMASGQKVKDGNELGKTIIFAKNHKHAEFIKERFDLMYPQLKGKFIRVIDNYIKYADTIIDEFSTKDKYPNIAVSVDMLDTGIDIPEILNLVFFKQVKSKVKFWQMIGRGTRLCPELFDIGKDKEYFSIFDYCANFEFFGLNPDGETTKVHDSLNQKIFKKRVLLTKHLQAATYQDNPKTKLLYESLLDGLHKYVLDMDVNDFIVRMHREYVDKFKLKKNWENLSEGDIADLMQHIAVINKVEYQEDETSKRFDLFVLNLQLSIVEGHVSVERYQNQLVATAGDLEKKANIPHIHEKLPLIKDIQQEDFWFKNDISDLERVRLELRDLIKFLDKRSKRSDVVTDFSDTLGEAVDVEGFLNIDLNLSKYRKKVESYLMAHRDIPVVQKIQSGMPISKKDLEEAEELLFTIAEANNKDDFRKLYDNNLGKLGAFIRRIVGLSRAAAKEKFAEFLDNTKYDANQIGFINQLINHIVRVGFIDPQELYEIPFNDYHYLGVEGLFSENELKVIFQNIDTINKSVLVEV